MVQWQSACLGAISIALAAEMTEEVGDAGGGGEEVLLMESRVNAKGKSWQVSIFRRSSPVNKILDLFYQQASLVL